ncbi:hypothetical protein [Algoriphagus persicinus]|uniref:hypothetical protein n=1 Tax=Algoriphagus persicinus TaxID=3108754 RepID=UPI002B3B7CF1|nr:hypothetical protein [Algoriphagus sp. E1-3-M2]MEB2786377.1 hypothetical protein [Algoriphagus sp. E1-3-M2]
MISTYSIVFTPFSAISNERVNLGLLMINEHGNTMFRYSSEKLSFIRNLLSGAAAKLIKSNLTTLSTKFSENKNEFFPIQDLSVDFMQYLADYSNNLISFTPPKSIDLELNENNFNKLFQKLVFHDVPVIVKPQISSISLIKKNFMPKVESRVNVDFQLKASEFDFVLFNLNVDMIGKNDRPVLTQFFDFEVSAESLKNRITNYLSLIKPFELQEKKDGKFFIVADEPTKEENSQHLIWEHLQESPLIKERILEIVPTTELDRVVQYLEEHDVRPFVAKA